MQDFLHQQRGPHDTQEFGVSIGYCGGGLIGILRIIHRTET